MNKSTSFLLCIAIISFVSIGSSCYAQIQQDFRLETYAVYAQDKFGNPGKFSRMRIYPGQSDVPILDLELGMTNENADPTTPVLPLYDNDALVADLEMVQEQKAELRTANVLIETKLKELVRSKIDEKGLISNEDRQQIKQSFSKFKSEQELAVYSILLPHQVSLLNGHRAKTEMARGVGRALTGKFLCKELGITQAQASRIEKVNVEAKKEMEKLKTEYLKKQAEIKKKFENSAISVLSNSQKEKLDELVNHNLP